MYNPSTQGIIIFIVSVSFLLLLLILFIITIVFRYQQKQNAYYREMEELKISYESAMLESQLEIQEETFQNISREIHDNIGQKLSLAKLYLNTINSKDNYMIGQKIENTIALIGDSLIELSDISRSMSSEIVLSEGLIKALQMECSQLLKAGLFKIDFSVYGEIEFLEAKKELVLFRIAQEALNNIVKHSAAKNISFRLCYNNPMLCMNIEDDGNGFDFDIVAKNGMGLIHMKKRAETINGTCQVISKPNCGTKIRIEIPFYDT